jgi:hypothetical protein
VEHQGKFYVTTGRNPQLIKIDIPTFTVDSVTLITELQVANPLTPGFYGSPETGYITDDISVVGDYLYLPGEVAKPGIVVVEIANLANRTFTPTNNDIFGSFQYLESKRKTSQGLPTDPSNIETPDRWTTKNATLADGIAGADATTLTISLSIL